MRQMSIPWSAELARPPDVVERTWDVVIMYLRGESETAVRERR
jgi:hypothetical protein